MPASDSISRKGVDLNDLNFTALREEGIALAQALSGNIWTDYNLHDPGVTILEQLCFGMTELAYQADEAIEYYLTNQRGVIDFNDFALFKPHEIFPTGAVTPEDYCKLLVDAVPEIGAINVRPVKNKNCVAGLYDITIKLLEPIVGGEFSNEKKEEIIKSVALVFQENRNLCEDLNEVNIELAEPCYLQGFIETTGSRDSADICADIFFQCARIVSFKVSIDRYEDMYSVNNDLELLFTGPLTQHGYINVDNFSSEGSQKSLQELILMISKIEGVKKIYQLDLVSKNNINSKYESIQKEKNHSKSYYVKFPTSEVQKNLFKIGVNSERLTDFNDLSSVTSENNDKILSSARQKLHQLEFHYGAFRNNKKNSANFYGLPEGKKHLDAEYFSIQEGFPNVYGVNSNGVAAFDIAERKVYAKQLKAYLFPFEQLMVNFLQQVNNMPSFFSLTELTKESYFSKFLNNKTIPNIEELYNFNGQKSQVIAKIRQHDDDVDERKSRALDVLLALYGEKFPHKELKSFNCYYDGEAWVVENKINFLKNIIEISSRRNGAFNYLKNHWNACGVGSFQKKIGILLGIKNFDSFRLLCDLFDGNKVTVVDDSVLLGRGSTVSSAHAELSAVTGLSVNQRRSLQKMAYRLGSSNLTISFSMLNECVRIEQYQTLVDGENSEHDENVGIYFQLSGESKSIFIEQKNNMQDAVLYAHKYRKVMVALNADLEGFHLVEHVLLRQCGEGDLHNVQGEGNFFNFRVSFVFPSWGARFSNESFRKFAEIVVHNNLPAHIYPCFYWLSFEEMQEFESRYKAWLDCSVAIGVGKCSKNKSTFEQESLNLAAKNLHTWLVSRKDTGNQCWWS